MLNFNHKGILKHFRKYVYLLSCGEWDKKNDTTRMYSKYAQRLEKGKQSRMRVQQGVKNTLAQCHDSLYIWTSSVFRNQSKYGLEVNLYAALVLFYHTSVLALLKQVRAGKHYTVRKSSLKQRACSRWVRPAELITANCHTIQAVRFLSVGNNNLTRSGQNVRAWWEVLGSPLI